MITKVIKSEFAKNFTTMLTGTAIAQAIPVLASLILVRIYAPDEIGAFSLFFTVVNLLAIIANLKYDEAIVLPHNDEDGRNIFYLSIFLNIIFSIFIFLITILFGKTIIIYLGYRQLEKWLLFIPLSIFLTGLFQSCNYWNNRKKEFRIIAVSRVTQNLLMSIIQILSSSFSIGGLIIGRILGLFASIFQSFALSPTMRIMKINSVSIYTNFYKYIDFAKYYTPNAFLNQFSNNLPIILFPSWFGMAYAGYYAFSTRIILAPMGIITSSIQQVFYQEIAHKKNNGENLYPYIFKTYKRLFFIGIIPHTLLFVFSPLIFGLFFGKEWRLAGEYTRYLVPWFFMVFLNSPVSGIYLVVGKQKQYLIIEFLLFISRLLAVFIGYIVFNNPSKAIMLYGFVGLMFNIYLCWYYLKISDS